MSVVSLLDLLDEDILSQKLLLTVKDSPTLQFASKISYLHTLLIYDSEKM